MIKPLFTPVRFDHPHVLPRTQNLGKVVTVTFDFLDDRIDDHEEATCRRYQSANFAIGLSQGIQIVNLSCDEESPKVVLAVPASEEILTTYPEPVGAGDEKVFQIVRALQLRWNLRGRNNQGALVCRYTQASRRCKPDLSRKPCNVAYCAAVDQARAWGNSERSPLRADPDLRPVLSFRKVHNTVEVSSAVLILESSKFGRKDLLYDLGDAWFLNGNYKQHIEQ